MNLGYRIYIDNLDRDVGDNICLPSKFLIRNFKDSDIEMCINLLNANFPAVFKTVKDFEKLFINKEYYNANNIFIAIDNETNNIVSFSGYQELKYFCLNSVSLIYSCTAKEYRRIGLFKFIYKKMCEQLKEKGITKLFIVSGDDAYNKRVYNGMGLQEMGEEYTRNFTISIQRDKIYERE